MESLVLCQVGCRVERLQTYLTGERLLARVDAFVSDQVARLFKVR